MDTNDIRAYMNPILQPVERDLPDQYPAIKQNIDALLTPVEAFGREMAALQQRGILTTKGLQEEAARRRDTLAAHLHAFEARTVKVLDERMQAERRTTLTPQARGDAHLDYLQEREVRDQLRAQDALIVQERYLSAARQGDNDLLVRAVENAPMGFELVNAATRKQADERDSRWHVQEATQRRRVVARQRASADAASRRRDVPNGL